MNRNSNRGASLVEFAIGFLPLLVIFGAVTDFGLRYFQTGMGNYFTQQVTREAASKLAADGGGIPETVVSDILGDGRGYGVKIDLVDVATDAAAAYDPYKPYIELTVTTNLTTTCVLCLFTPSNSVNFSARYFIEDDIR